MHVKCHCQGTSVNERNGKLETPLHKALKSSISLEMCKFLLQNGCDVNAKNSQGETGSFVP